MKLKSTSIKAILKNINNDKILLPPIQRNFVWDYDRIVNLFDSMYRNYPIGNLILWRLSPETAQTYPLFKFILNYTEDKKKMVKNEPFNAHLVTRDIFAVVDGQQRLSSLYIGLFGTYKYKVSGKGKQNVSVNFVKSVLQFNVFADDKKEDKNEDLFVFRARDSAKFINDKNLWMCVSDVLKWKNKNDIEDYCDKILFSKLTNSKKKQL